MAKPLPRNIVIPLTVTIPVDGLNRSSNQAIKDYVKDEIMNEIVTAYHEEMDRRFDDYWESVFEEWDKENALRITREYGEKDDKED